MQSIIPASCRSATHLCIPRPRAQNLSDSFVGVEVSPLAPKARLNPFVCVEKCVCVFFMGALLSSATMSLVRGAAYAAVFMAGQGCTLGHLFQFSEEGALLCRLRSSPVFVSEFPAQGACIRGNGFKFQANLQLGKGKEGLVRF